MPFYAFSSGSAFFVRWDYSLHSLVSLKDKKEPTLKSSEPKFDNIVDRELYLGLTMSCCYRYIKNHLAWKVLNL